MKTASSRDRAAVMASARRHATATPSPRPHESLRTVSSDTRRAAQVKISDLEGALQHFINQSFENITSIENSLGLLATFQAILQRETLKSDLEIRS